MTKSDLFVVLCIACLALAGFNLTPALGFLALAAGFGFFALAHADEEPTKKDGDD